MTHNAKDRDDLMQAFREKFGLSDLSEQRLDQSFTHSSYAFEKGLPADNERLEFLGDAVLSTIVSEYIFRMDRGAHEGELSKLRAHLVSRAMLGRRAADMGFGDLMLLGVGESRNGGRRRRSTLGGALEALIGVIYIDHGFEQAKQFIVNHVARPLLDEMELESFQGDFKSALQEWSQEHRKALPKYERIAETGPDHAKVFRVRVIIDGEELAQGEGRRLKAAENEAAREALELLTEPYDI